MAFLVPVLHLLAAQSIGQSLLRLITWRWEGRCRERRHVIELAPLDLSTSTCSGDGGEHVGVGDVRGGAEWGDDAFFQLELAELHSLDLVRRR